MNFSFKMDINDLPLETFVEILRRTDGCTLARCRQVCLKWKEVIDGTVKLWQTFCEKDFKYSSKIAKRKAGEEFQWYHIYRNLKMWSTISSAEKKLRTFYKFNVKDKFRALEVDYNVLPLRDAKGFMLYEVSTFKYIPVAIPERNCLKISSNDSVTVILTNYGLFLQRSVDNTNHESFDFFLADNFVLCKNMLYFYNNRDLYECNLNQEKLMSKLILNCDYDIKEIQANDEMIYLFTDCGKIVTVNDKRNMSVKPISIPMEWIKQIKHVSALDDKNFVCYSRNLFKIETDKYQHLYLDFPTITALFFYGDVVIIGSVMGEILLYRLSSQKKGAKPIFENLAVLPDKKFAIHLDVCERKTGPVIIVGTLSEVFLLDFDFFPDEQPIKQSFSLNKINLYKRLLKLRDSINNK